MRRLPWGVYLALWGCGMLLVASIFPMWSGYIRYHKWLGDRYPVNLWQALSDIYSGRAVVTQGFWPNNIRTTLIILAAGAALGAALRWVCRIVERSDSIE